MEEREQPSSSGVSPIQLKDCIEDLLKFTLQSSSIEESPPLTGLDLGLSKHYCSNLLKDDDYAPAHETDLSEGVPPHPLYKHLASALCQSISSGTFCRMTKKPQLIHEHSSLEQKESEWSKLIVDKGSDLVKMLKTVDIELHVQEPFFSQLKDGLKTVEGRCAVGDYQLLEPGALILFNKCLVLQVLDVHRYPSFYEMLGVEGLAKVLPGVETIEEGVQIYRNFYSEEKERSNGVLAIHITKPASQLYDPLTSILAVNSSKLSGGARALAKHVNRSGERFWGSVVGSDSDKNMHAADVINHIIAHCCWLNMHVVPPHGAVFEIRVRDGYGARWSLDGTKFIGFLEPYMEDGHTKGWKH